MSRQSDASLLYSHPSERQSPDFSTTPAISIAESAMHHFNQGESAARPVVTNKKQGG